MKAIELRDKLDELFSEDEAYKDYSIFTATIEYNKNVHGIANVNVNTDSKFGKIIWLFE